MTVGETDGLQSTVSKMLLAEFLQSAKAGSRSGLGKLLESFRPSLESMAVRRLGQRLRRRMSSSDLVQETMLSAGKEFDSFRGASPDEFQNWLRELFHSRLVDGLRRHQVAEMRRQDLEDDRASLSGIADQNPTASKLAALNEDARQLLNALRDMPSEYQTILRMRYLDDRTFEDMAAELNVSVATVWRRFQEAVEGLQILLQR
jgi:RNA polymerase sigma-70 factor (ECF subfamily)